MKKIFVSLLIFIFSCGISYAKEDIYILTAIDKSLIINITNKINKIIDKKGDIVTSQYVSTINKALKKYNKDSRIYIILNSIKTEIVTYSQDKYKKEKIALETKRIEKAKKNEELKSNYKSTTNFSDFKIDMDKVRNSWLGYYNEVRKNMGRDLYSIDSKLNNSAQEWADTSLAKGVLSHQRNTGDSYYDYNKINSRFKNRGVVCKNINRITHSENIGRGFFACSDSNDCTEKLISGMKPVFDWYMAEKGKTSHAHYDSIIMKEFSKIGLGISIKKSGNNSYEFYMTTHYCTSLE